MAKQVIDVEKLDCMVSRLKAIAHPVRISIIEMLVKNGKMSVGDIQRTLNLEQAAISNHLRIMKDNQILSSVRVGQSKLYSVREAKFASILKCIELCSE